MLRAFLRKGLNFRFSNYEVSMEKYNTLQEPIKAQWTLNNKITFYGVPHPTQQSLFKLIDMFKQHQKVTPVKTVILLSDCSKNLFVNYQLADQAFREKFYKNITNIDEQSVIDKINLDVPDSIKECYLISDTFLKGIWKNQKDDDEHLDYNQQNVDIIRTKLNVEYDVDPLLSIVATFSFFQNPQSLVIGGISQLLIRRAIVNDYPLEDLKQIFINFAKQIKDLKNQGLSDPSTLYYTLLEMFEDHFPQIFIGKQAQQLFYLLHQVQQDCIVLGKTPVLDRVDELFKITTPDIHRQIRESESVRKLLSLPKSQQQDQVKIQKHALLQAILQTGLWNKQYVYNPFPYLQQNYLQLNPQEQQTVKQRYAHHLNRYTSAWKKMIS